jgi:hypothetical protein
MGVDILVLPKLEPSSAAVDLAMVGKIDTEDFSTDVGQCYFTGLRSNFRAFLTSA